MTDQNTRPEEAPAQSRQPEAAFTETVDLPAATPATPPANAAHVAAPAPAGKRRRWRWLAYAVAGTLGLLLLLWAGLRLYYSDERLRVLAEEKISEALGVRCRIGVLAIYSGDLSAEIKQISLEETQPASGTQSLEMVALEKLRADLCFWQSIMRRELVLDLKAEGVTVRINRVRLPDKGVDEADRFTTNIHPLLGNILGLPWKHWLTSFDWRLAAGSISIERAQVQLNDQAGILGPCIFHDIQLSLTREGRLCKLSAAFQSQTPAARDGRFALKAQAEIGDPLAVSAEQLAFITNLGLESDFDSLDAPYVARYYGAGGRGRAGWQPGAPLDGKLRASAPTMQALTLELDFSTPEAVRILEDGKPVPGAPQLRLNANGIIDCSREWNAFNPLKLHILGGGLPGQRKNEWLELNAELRGSLADSLILTSNCRVTGDGFGESSFGRVAHLDKTFSGIFKTALSVKLEKGRPLKFNLNALSEDLIFHTPKGDAPAPLELDLSGGLTLDETLAAQSGDLSLRLNAQTLVLHSPKPWLLSFKDGGSAAGALEIKADLGALSRNLARPLEAIGIGTIDENAAGTLALREDGALEWNLTFNRPDYGAVTVQGAGSLAADGAFSIQTALNQSSAGGILFNLKSSGKLTPATFEATFENQLSAQLDSLYALRKRLQGFFPGAEPPAQKLTGLIREAARGRISRAGPNFSLVAGVSSQADNIGVTGGGALWQEKQVTLSGSLQVNSTLAGTQFKVAQLDLLSSAGNLKLKSELVDTALFHRDLATLVLGLPAFQIDANLSPVFFSRLSGLAGEALPPFLREGQSLLLKANSAGGRGAWNVEACRLQAKDLALNLLPFTFNADRFTTQLQAGNTKGALAAFSPLSATASCGPGFWAALPLPPGLRMAGTLSVSAAYNPAEDRLRLPKVEFAAQREDAALVNALLASVEISDFSRLLNGADLYTTLSCLPAGFTLSRADISIPALQSFADLQHAASLRALQGKLLSVRDLQLTPVKPTTPAADGSLEFNLYAKTNLDMAFYSADSRWPLLSLNGGLTVMPQAPLRVRIGKNYAGLAGALDLTGAEVRFAALSPYVYNKPKRIPSRLSFSLVRQDSGAVALAGAELSGGPLGVKLGDLSFSDFGNGVFRLQLNKAEIGAPFNLKINDILIDKSADQIRADAVTSGIDLTALGNQLTLEKGLRLSGKIGPTELHLNDRYRSFLGGRDAPGGGLGPNNRLTLGAVDLSLTALRGEETIRAGLSLAGGSVDTGRSEVLLQGIRIDKPDGFSAEDPLVIRQIRLTPDTRTIFSDSFVIDRLDIKGLEATFELGLKGNNIEALRRNTDRLFSTVPAGTPVTAEPADPKRKTWIRDLYTEGGNVKLTSKLLGGKAALPVLLPPIHMQNIGGEGSSNVFQQLSEILLKSILTNGSSLLKGVGGLAGGVADSTAGVLGDAASGAAGAVGNVAEGTAGLFGGLGRTLGRTVSGGADGKKADAPSPSAQPGGQPLSRTAMAELLTRSGLKPLAGEPNTYAISGVKLADIAQRLGFDPKQMRPAPNQPRAGDIRTAMVQGRYATIESQVRDRQGQVVRGSLDNPDAICSVQIFLPPGE